MKLLQAPTFRQPWVPTVAPNSFQRFQTFQTFQAKKQKGETKRRREGTFLRLNLGQVSDEAFCCRAVTLSDRFNFVDIPPCLFFCHSLYFTQNCLDVA